MTLRNELNVRWPNVGQLCGCGIVTVRVMDQHFPKQNWEGGTAILEGGRELPQD